MYILVVNDSLYVTQEGESVCSRGILTMMTRWN